MFLCVIDIFKWSLGLISEVKKLAVANVEKENRCICYFIKYILFLFGFFILLQATKYAIQKGVNITSSCCSNNKKFIICVWARNGIMKLIAYVLLFGNMFQNTFITYKGLVTFNRFGCTYIERSIRLDSKNVCILDGFVCSSIYVLTVNDIVCKKGAVQLFFSYKNWKI